MKKRRERSSTEKQKVCNDDRTLVDKISDLPDELLRHILCFLPTNIAFTTSVLSKRWTRLCYSLPVLRFEDETINNIDAYHCFCRIVDTVMLSPRATNQPLKMFILKCPFIERERDNPFNLTKWIEAIKRHPIEEMHLTISFRTLKPIIFISQTLVVLKLETLNIGKDTSCVDLPSLKTLNLKYASFVNWNDYIKFLYACPILEDLYVDYISREMKHEERFKSLTLSKLVKASIESTDALFNGIDNVKFLSITPGYGSNEASFKFIPTFSNLIHIELLFGYRSIHCWDGVVELLCHAPKLQILFIRKWAKTSSSEEWNWPISVLECVLSHLRLCTILNFDVSANDLRFAKYILHNASLLQHMKIGVATDTFKERLSKKGQIKEELSSCPRISQGCKFSFI